ncbi:hypothetical protein RE9416_41100 [Prescottella equi]|nr:hypothetical protein RE9416_41100 [Prescottella equi]
MGNEERLVTRTSTPLSVAELRQVMQADLQAHGLSRWLPHYRLSRVELSYQRSLRVTEFLLSRGGLVRNTLGVLARIRLKRRSVRTGVSLPPGVAAAGLSIAHVGSTVVNDNARIGRFCRLHTSVNIGTYQGKAPVIGDFVYIAPGAVIYGGVSIGDRAVVGSNAVVNADVPAGVTVAGSPAKIISGNDSRSVMPEWIRMLMDRETG